MVNTSKFDSLIKELEGQIRVLRDRIEKTCKEFFEATNEFAVEWFQSCVERAVISNPELAKKSGVAGLRNLKSDLQNLAATVPSIVEKHLNIDRCWPHRRQIPDKPDPQLGRYQDYWRRLTIANLKNAVAEVLGYVGGVLVKHGFADTGPASAWAVIAWSEQPKYTCEYDWSQKLNAVFGRYSDLYGQLIELDGELKKVQREKAEAEAKGLWDQA